MKQITNVAIGGRNFIISNEAYAILDSWLERFRSKIEPASQADDVMVEIEERIAELFTEAASGPNYVVDTDLVHKVIGQLGMPDGSDPDGSGARRQAERPAHRFYRDSDDKEDRRSVQRHRPLLRHRRPAGARDRRGPDILRHERILGLHHPLVPLPSRRDSPSEMRAPRNRTDRREPAALQNLKIGCLWTR